MTRLTYILLFIPFLGLGQNLYTNEPDLVYPILEEFVAENYNRDKRSFERIIHLDSIVVKSIPYILIPATKDRPAQIEKVYGYHKKKDGKEWIEIDVSLLNDKQKFHKTLLHELKHVFGFRDHVDASGYPYDHPIYEDIMAKPSLPYYVEPEKWERMKSKYYDSLKNISYE